MHGIAPVGIDYWYAFRFHFAFALDTQGSPRLCFIDARFGNDFNPAVSPGQPGASVAYPP